MSIESDEDATCELIRLIYEAAGDSGQWSIFLDTFATIVKAAARVGGLNTEVGWRC